MPSPGPHTPDLFGDPGPDAPETLAPGAVVLRGFALGTADTLLAGIDAVAQAAPLRHMVTPGGFEMSVAMSNCGRLGWTTDRGGYRYRAEDPLRQAPWPPMPPGFEALAIDAAAAAGYPGFRPDACLVNRYRPGARMSLHQDRNEHDFDAPIVSVSLGLPATFLFGGDARGDRAARVPLRHGDVVVWGGPSRLRFHGVAPLKDGVHPAVGPWRYNLTFRKAGRDA